MVVRLVALARGTVQLLAIPFGIGAAFALSPWFGNWQLIDLTTFYRAGTAVLHGGSPYPPADVAFLASEVAYVYPPFVAVIMALLAALPFGLAAALYALAAVGAIVGALLLLGVRDPRCHFVVFLYPFTLNGVWVGTISPFLLLGLACAWRWRDRVWRLALCGGALVAAKLFLAPFVVWLVATRRYRAALLAPVVSLVVVLGTWALLGFAGLEDYRDMLRILSEALAGDSYSPTALGLALGLSNGVATGSALVLAAAAALAALLVGRRGTHDALAFALALGASLAASPIVWPHYFMLLIAPLALARPRFGGAWVLPLAFWFMSGESGGSPVLIALVLGLVALALLGPHVMRGGPSATRGRAQEPEVASGVSRAPLSVPAS